jgi:2-polyprenyl-3-methyl-5-hydroxy-6-metoxy-1,4-benzoquinol methylase
MKQIEKSEIPYIDNSLKHTTCPICASHNIKKMGTLTYQLPITYSTTEISLFHTPELWKCDNCLSWFSQYIVNEQDSIELYSSGKSEERWDSDEIFEQTRTKDVCDILNSYFIPDKQLLDIGCAAGALLDYAKAKGCKTFGLEYSVSASAILREKGHIAFSSFEKIDRKFDIITAFDLVEHLYDFQMFIEQCKHLLNPGGVMIFMTGDNSSDVARRKKNEWWYASLCEHIIFPSRQAYTLSGLSELLYKTVSRFNVKKITKGEIARRFIRLFSKSYNKFPFQDDHYIIILKAK